MFRGTKLQVTTYFAVVCLLSISFLVFVNASISFVITDILQKQSNVGDNVGTLGFADELVAMVACPVWGVLSDRIGTRPVVVVSYIIIGISLFSFVNVANVFPGLLLVRILFSVGGAGASTMVTAILPSLTGASLDSQRPKAPVNVNGPVSTSTDIFSSRTWSSQGVSDVPEQKPQPVRSGSFRIAGLVGMAAGCGALVAVFGFLRLPPYFQERHIATATALKDTFYIVGGVALLAALFAFVGLRRLMTESSTAGRTRGLVPYWRLPYLAISTGFRNHAIGLAYVGGFVARASSVGISLFIPLWINSYYITSGRCQIHEPSSAKDECRDAYKLSSAITGVSQLAALLSAPLFGIVSERLRRHRAPLLLAAIAGVASYITLAFTNDPRIREGSLGPLIFLVAASVGISQVGAIVCSLGLLGHEIALSEAQHNAGAGRPADSTATEALIGGDSQHPQPTADREIDENDHLLDHGAPERRLSSLQTDDLISIKGSIAGMYSFAGGVAILLLTKVGGVLFDANPAAPFWILAGFNCILLVSAGASILSSMVSWAFGRVNARKHTGDANGA